MKTWTNLIAAVALLSAPALADEMPASDITGKWSGQGFVQKDENSRKVKVRCKVDGDETGDKIEFEGVCRAMLIMKRDIGAWITRAGGTFSGTYKGADAGISQLDGKEVEPGRVELTMTFPRMVHTDDEAIMMIDRPDNDSFTITTFDIMSSGEEITTSSIHFTREDAVASTN